MNVIILAAGYGTRLGSAGGGRPKALLELGGRPILEHILEQLDGLALGWDSYLVTNDRFFPAFEKWRGEASGGSGPVPRILNDGTAEPAERLGAVRDLALALEHCGFDQSALLLVSDALFDFSMRDFVAEFARRVEADVLLAIQEETDPEALRSRAVVGMSPDGRILFFQEKPEEPISQLTALPVYLLRPSALALVGEYIGSGGDVDAPGHLMAWLVDRVRVVGWVVHGSRIDVGTPDGYRRARERYRKD